MNNLMDERNFGFFVVFAFKDIFNNYGRTLTILIGGLKILIAQ